MRGSVRSSGSVRSLPHRLWTAGAESGSAASLLEARGLSVGYGSGAVVRDLDLTVGPGEVVALLGPNGAGKSTTLLALAGELRPLAGVVSWKGSVSHAPLHRRARQGLAFIPEDRSVFSGLTVSQNSAVRWKASDRFVAGSTSSGMFPELVPLASRRAGLLSGGEQRMLAVDRALSGGCSLLLADELSLGLAPKTVGRILQALRTAASEGVGVLVVEQHVHRVLDIADRVCVMQGGRLRWSGSATQARQDMDSIRDQYLSSHGHAK